MIGTWERVLVLAPHTDDGEFGCGGTMARLAEAGFRPWPSSIRPLPYPPCKALRPAACRRAAIFQNDDPIQAPLPAAQQRS